MRELVRNGVVAINTATPATSLAKLEEIEAHFAARVREVVTLPYDPHLAAGSVVDFAGLLPDTRIAARELAAAVMDGLIGGDRVTVRPIRLFGDPVLRSICDPIRPGDPKAAVLIADLIDTVKEPGRAGLAANQIGVGLRAFSVNIDGAVEYVINPELVEVSGEPVLVDEGCLSVPGFSFPRLRYPFARVRGVDLDGNPVELSGDGTMGRRCSTRWTTSTVTSTSRGWSPR